MRQHLKGGGSRIVCAPETPIRRERWLPPFVSFPGASIALTIAQHRFIIIRKKEESHAPCLIPANSICYHLSGSVRTLPISPHALIHSLFRLPSYCAGTEVL